MYSKLKTVCHRRISQIVANVLCCVGAVVIVCGGRDTAVAEKFSEQESANVSINEVAMQAASDGILNKQEQVELLQFGPPVISVLKKHEKGLLFREFVTEVESQISARDSDQGTECAEAIGYFKELNAELFIIPALDHDDIAVRARAVKALTKAATLKSFPFVLAHLKDAPNREYDVPFGLPFDGELNAALGLQPKRLASILNRLLREQGVTIPSGKEDGASFIAFCEEWWQRRQVDKK